MQLKIDIKEFKKVKESLKKLENFDKKALLEIVANPIENATRESFSKEEDPWGNPWKNKNSKTYHHLDSKERNMQNSLHSHINANEAVVGFSASHKGYPYPAVHQFGSKKRSGRGSNIPARPFMPITLDGKLEQKVKEQILENMEDFLNHPIKNSLNE